MFQIHNLEAVAVEAEEDLEGVVVISGVVVAAAVEVVVAGTAAVVVVVTEATVIIGQTITIITTHLAAKVENAPMIMVDRVTVEDMLKEAEVNGELIHIDRLNQTIYDVFYNL